MAAAQAHVVREGERRSIEATHIVPGDIMVVEEGDTIAADARVIRSTALQTAEASLTGESLPVSKDPAAIHRRDRPRRSAQHDLQRDGRHLCRGRAVVVASGMRTEMGRIAGLLAMRRRKRRRSKKSWTAPEKVLGSPSSSSPS